MQTNLKAIARFRLLRHHLLDEGRLDPVTICRDVCGVQAQVMSSAFLQLWTRNHSLTRSEIEEALWRSRTLVKTSLMRQTLHLVPTDEFHIYIAALKSSRIAGAKRVMARFAISSEEGEGLTPLILEALSSGAQGRSAIRSALRPKVSKRVRAYMDAVWSALRLPIAEGLICYRCGEGNEVSFIRVDQWLPHLKRMKISETEAQLALFRKYLRAYGPATPRDFAHWAGIPMPQAKALPVFLAAELEEVSGDQKGAFLLREDVAAFEEAKNESRNKEKCVRLLPSFDTYLLAHRTKEHLLSVQHYKRVYRNQAWISPVVLIDGAVAGVWSYKIKGKQMLVEVALFEKVLRRERAEIVNEAECLGRFFDRELTCRFT